MCIWVHTHIQNLKYSLLAHTLTQCTVYNTSQGLLLTTTLVPNAKAFSFFYLFTAKHGETLCAAPELVKQTDTQAVAGELGSANVCL